MVEPNWVRHSIQLAIVGVHQAMRRLRRNPYRLRFLGIGVIGLGIWFGGMGILFALLLRSLEGPIPISTEVSLGVSVLWVFAVWFFAQRALLYWRRPKAKQFVLVTVSTQTTAAGMLLTEFFVTCLALLLPTVLLVGVIGYAFLSPVSLLLIPLAVGLFAASTIVIGYVLTFAYLFIPARFHRISNQTSDLLIQVVFFVISVLLIAQIIGVIPAVWEVLTFAWLPPSWLVDLAILGTPVTASFSRALASVIGFLTVICGGGLAVGRLADAYWIPRSSSTADDGGNTASDSQSHSDGGLASAISPFIIPRIAGRPTQRMAQLTLLRLRRNPRRLLFLVTLVTSLGIYLGVVYVQIGGLLSLVPVVCALFFPWLAGAIFGLNPLGDEETALPATLTSSISGHQYAGGLMIPGLLYGLPVTFLSTLVGTIVSPYPLIDWIGFLAVGTTLNVAAVSLAPASGMRFPRFSSSAVGQRGRVVPPSMLAVAVYSLTIGLLGVGLILLLLAPASIYELVTNGWVPVEWARIVGIVSGIIIVVMISKLGFNSVARQFEQHTLS